MISVIVPCRNEEGNISHLIQSVSNLSVASEIIFVEGGSSDNTFELIQNSVNADNHVKMSVIKQTGKGKFNAVLAGVSQATSEFIAIWDGDNTINSIDQNDLMIKFLKMDPQKSFVTANRINAQRDKKAIKSINLIGNYVFSRLVAVVLKQGLPDVLAGTKIFPKYILDADFGCSQALRLDPFGDVYIIAMAAKANLAFHYFDCRYQERFYGESNIKRWSGGLALFQSIIHFRLHACASRDMP